MEEDFENTSHWTKEGWVKKFREIWRSPEDMKERLRRGLQLFFSSPHLHLTTSLPTSSTASTTSHSSTNESVSRLLYLWSETATLRDNLLALEIAQAFETWMNHSLIVNCEAPSSVVDSPSPEFALSIDGESRAKALNIASLTLNGAQIPALYETLFQFTQHKDELKLDIDRRLEQRQNPGELIAAARMITALNLQSGFDFAYVVSPLILADKMQLVDAFVGKDDHLRMQLTSLFDLWASLRTHKLVEFFEGLGLDPNNKGYKSARLNQKTLGKMTTNLVKKYGLNEEEACPLLLEYREKGFMRHQTIEFLKKQTVDEQTWADNVESAVRRRPKIASAIVDILTDMKDYQRAAKWLKKLDLPLDHVNPTVIQKYRRLPNKPVTFGEEENDLDVSSNEDSPYLTFPLPMSSVLMIDDVEKYDRFINELDCIVDAAESAEHQRQSIRMGVDAEWPPQQSNLGISRVALLQIAVSSSKVFLLDILTLSSVLTKEQWVNGLGKKFIANASICKLGFGLHDDFKVLMGTVTGMKEAGITASNILEMNKVSDSLSKKAPLIFDIAHSDMQSTRHSSTDQSRDRQQQHQFPDRQQQHPSPDQQHHPSPDQQPHHSQQEQHKSVKRKSGSQETANGNAVPKSQGLSALVGTLLGKPLDKRPQCSDWNRRPLRESQIIYAALDALVLILVYDKIVERIKALNLQELINFEEFTDSKIRKEEAEEKEERKRRKREKQELKKKEIRTQKGLKTAVRSEEFAEEMKSASLTLDESKTIISPKSLRVVCDNMLQGLGRQLRLCGVDVVILGNNDDHDVAARIAVDEERVILTCGKTFDRLKKHVAPGRCFSVTPTLAKTQCLEVLQRFNVRVDPKDIFSRCQLCNTDQWTVVPVEIIYHLWDKFVEEDKRRKGRLENWGSGKPMRKSNWSPLKDEKSEDSLNEVVEENGNETKQDETATRAVGEEEDGWKVEGERDSELPVSGSTDSLDDVINRAAALGISFKDGTFYSPISHKVVSLDLVVIPQPVFDNVKNFYLCSLCAKIYWDGSHYERTNNIYADVLGFDVAEATEKLKIEDS